MSTPGREQIREQIKTAFEAARETPGAAFEEHNLVWYLIAKPDGGNGIHNSGKGKRRLRTFLQALESHYSICFSVKDWWHLRSLDQIEERTAFLLSSTQSSLASIRNTLKDQPDMLRLLLVFIFLPPTALAFKFLGIPGLLLLIVPMVLVLALNRWDENRKDFYRAIEAKIKASKASAKGA